jgi:hypothetical protein
MVLQRVRCWQRRWSWRLVEFARRASARWLSSSCCWTAGSSSSLLWYSLLGASLSLLVSSSALALEALADGALADGALADGAVADDGALAGCCAVTRAGARG